MATMDDPNFVDVTLTDDLVTQAEALYPWAVRLGLLHMVVGLIQDDASPEEILATIRKTPEWRAQFPGFYAEDGSRRFSSEAEYMRTVDDLRNVMKEYGVYQPEVDAPLNYVGLIENGIDPNEFRQRFETYRQLEAGTKELRDAFYLYAGLTVEVDDLYRATVDPSYQDHITRVYDEAVALNPLDYETYITRGTEIALKDLSGSVRAAVQQGIVPDTMYRDLLSVDPNVARGWLDVLATSAGGQFVSFADLNQSFQYAMLASAASERGLALPERDRLEQFIQAGVSRASANRAYSTFAQQQFGLAGMAARARVGEIDQTLFEEATLLADGESQAKLQQAITVEQNLSRSNLGGFQTRLDGDRVTQTGR